MNKTRCPSRERRCFRESRWIEWERQTLYVSQSAEDIVHKQHLSSQPLGQRIAIGLVLSLSFFLLVWQTAIPQGSTQLMRDPASYFRDQNARTDLFSSPSSFGTPSQVMIDLETVEVLQPTTSTQIESPPYFACISEVDSSHDGLELLVLVKGDHHQGDLHVFDEHMNIIHTFANMTGPLDNWGEVDGINACGTPESVVFTTPASILVLDDVGEGVLNITTGFPIAALASLYGNGQNIVLSANGSLHWFDNNGNTTLLHSGETSNVDIVDIACDTEGQHVAWALGMEETSKFMLMDTTTMELLVNQSVSGTLVGVDLANFDENPGFEIVASITHDSAYVIRFFNRANDIATTTISQSVYPLEQRPTIIDLNRDGIDEILVGSGYYIRQQGWFADLEAQLTAFDAYGTLLEGFPLEIEEVGSFFASIDLPSSFQSPMVIRRFINATFEVIFQTINGGLIITNTVGEVRARMVSHATPQITVCGDLDGDFDEEIVVLSSSLEDEWVQHFIEVFAIDNLGKVSVCSPMGGYGSSTRFSDQDQDLLTDDEELLLGLDPTLPDSDFDGMNDLFEAMYDLNMSGDDSQLDIDCDGLTNSEEFSELTDPTNGDTDGDLLGDGSEVYKFGTDPLVADGDNDGLSDGYELLIVGSDPFKEDTDGDGLSDGVEVLQLGSSPLLTDSDHDSLSDGDEHFFTRTNPSAADSDLDGLDDNSELELGCDPWCEDSDQDGLLDGREVHELGTDPMSPDSDGDGVNDASEVESGTSPTSAIDNMRNRYLAIAAIALLVILRIVASVRGKRTTQRMKDAEEEGVYSGKAEQVQQITGRADGKTRTIEGSKLSFQLIFSARRRVVVTLIGIVIASCLVSQGMFLTTAMQEQSFRQYVVQQTPQQMNIRFSSFKLDTSFRESFVEDTVSGDTAKHTSTVVLDMIWRTRDMMAMHRQLDGRQLGWDEEGKPARMDGRFVGLDEMLHGALGSCLEANGTMPSNANEYVLVAPRRKTGGYDHFKGMETEFHYPNSLYPSSWVAASASINLTMTGMIYHENLPMISVGGLNVDTSLMLGESADNIYYVTSIPHAENIMRRIPDKHLYTNFETEIFFDLTRLDAQHSAVEKEKFIRLVLALYTDLKGIVPSIQISSQIDEALDAYAEEYKKAQFFFFEFASLGMFVAVGLTFYVSLLQTEERRAWLLRIKIRGVSRNQLVGYLILESLCYGLFAGILGGYLGMNTARMMSRSAGFLQIGSSGYDILFDWTPILVAALFSSLLLLAASARQITILSRIETSDEDLAFRDSDEAPFWHWSFLDFIILGLSFVFWLQLLQAKASGEGSVSFSFAQIVGPLVPALFTIGTFLLWMRIGRPALYQIAALTWKSGQSLLSLSAATLAARRRTTDATVIVVSLTIGITLSALMVSGSMTDFGQEQARYYVGSDVHVYGSDVYGEDISTAVDLLDEIEAATEVYTASFMFSNITVQNHVEIMGVHPDQFLSASALYDDFFPDISVSEAMAALELPRGALIAESTKDVIGSSSQICLKHLVFNGSYQEISLSSVNVEGVFSLWPSLVDSTTGSGYKNWIVMVVSVDTFLTVAEELVLTEYDYSHDVLIKLVEGTLIESAAARISTRFGTDYEVASLEESLTGSHLRRRMFYAGLNSSFLAAALVSLVAIAFRGNIELKARQQELGILRAIGAQRSRIFIVTILDAVVILLISLAIGLLIALVTGNVLMEVVFLEETLLPVQMRFDWEAVGFVSAVLGLVGLLGAMLPSAIYSRKQPVQLMGRI